MKTIFLFLCAASLCVVRPSYSDDACCASAPNQVEARLAEIDLKVMLAMYERVRTECAEAEVARLLLAADTDVLDSERDRQTTKLDHRISRLQANATGLRNQILQLGKEVAVASK
jgi:hypothetical protein